MKTLIIKLPFTYVFDEINQLLFMQLQNCEAIISSVYLSAQLHFKLVSK